MRRRIAGVLCSLPLACAAASAWLPVKDVSLVVEPGSILDFSALVGTPRPLERPVTVTSQGSLGLDGGAVLGRRFLIASLGFGLATGSFPDHATADLYARQARMHGYNMVRLDHVEDTLLHKRQADFGFDPEQRDRFLYLLAALRREGIYYVLNGLSSDNGGYGGIDQRWVDQRQLRLRLYYDPQAQAHWKNLIDELLGKVNPHTGQSVLADPALAGLILVNEGGLPFVTRKGVPDALRPRFAEWLKKKYGNTASLAGVWGSELANGETLEAHSVGFPKPDAWTGKRMSDTQQFFVDLEKEAARWMTAHLRAAGYAGPVTAYNDWLSPAAHLARGQFAWVDMHNYFSAPTRFVAPGSVMRQDSMLDDGARYVQELAASRHVGRAFTVTEYGQVFWNRYRRETALAVPAYAAFQGWDAIAQHAGAFELSYAAKGGRKDAIYPYMVGLDPVARANETLAALLFLRGDVAPAQRLIGVRLDQSFVFDQSAFLGNMPQDISRLALVTGLGLDWLGQREDRCDAQVLPGNGDWLGKGAATAEVPAEKSLAGSLDSLAKRYAGKFGNKFSKTRLVVEDRWERRVAALRSKGLLLPGNATDAEAGVFQSDTGEITLDSQKRRLTVITPRTEAVVFDAPERIPLDALTVEQADGPALISVSAIDGKAVGESRRLLVVLATDARNSGMSFSDAAETTLKNLGTMPVLIKAAKVKLQLKNSNAGKLAVYSTTLRGRRGDAVPVTKNGGAISFTLDTSVLSHGPTTYFEIVSKEPS